MECHSSGKRRRCSASFSSHSRSCGSESLAVSRHGGTDTDGCIHQQGWLDVHLAAVDAGADVWIASLDSGMVFGNTV